MIESGLEGKPTMVESEAIDAINKYSILKELGSAYTWDLLDELEYVDFLCIIEIMNLYAKATQRKLEKMKKNVGPETWMSVRSPR